MNSYENFDLNFIQNDKKIAEEYLYHLVKNNLPIYKNVDLNNPLRYIFSFYPLPFEFQTDYLTENHQVLNRKNIYYFYGKPGNRLLYANRRLPFFKKDPIPFSYFITNENKTNIIQSNTFYYEVQILEEKFREPWKEECLSIGFGSHLTNIYSHVGWTDKSWGFHSDDGCYYNMNNGIPFVQPWTSKNIYGVGLTYENENVYSLFLTKNGNLCNKEIKIECSDFMIPMIGLDLSSPVKVNFGNEPFSFKLEKYIKSYNILSINYNFIKNKETKEIYKIVPDVNLQSNSSIYKKIISNNLKNLYPKKLISISDTEFEKNKNKINDDIKTDDKINNKIENKTDIDKIDYSGNYLNFENNYNFPPLPQIKIYNDFDKVIQVYKEPIQEYMFPKKILSFDYNFSNYGNPFSFSSLFSNNLNKDISNNIDL